MESIDVHDESLEAKWVWMCCAASICMNDGLLGWLVPGISNFHEPQSLPVFEPLSNPILSPWSRNGTRVPDLLIEYTK